MFIWPVNFPTIISLLGLVCAVSGSLLSLDHRIAASASMLILAGICDLFDGVIARRRNLSEDEKEFGLHIDSIVDMASFGICPIIICIGIIGEVLWYDFVIASFYAICAALRLAWFNVNGLSYNDTRSYFTGLPVTYSALIIPVGLLFSKVLQAPEFNWFIRSILLISAFLFIAKLKIPKPKGIALVIFPIAALLMIGIFNFFY